MKRIIWDDNGNTWGPPEVLFAEPGTFLRQPMISLDDGAWLIPIFKCRTEPQMQWIGSDDVSCVRMSKDQEKSWTEREVPNSIGYVHMNVRRLRDKTYLALFRSLWADDVYMSNSPDGLEWPKAIATDLPNPTSGICFDVLPS